MPYKTILIKNSRVILPDKIIRADIFIKGNKIADIGRKECRAGVTIDAKNKFIAPGFIDLHVHGNVEKISDYFVKYGTCGFLFTPLAIGINSVCKQLAVLKTQNITGAKVLGVHLEGPFINKKMAGAIPKKSLACPSVKLLNKLVKRSGNTVKIITISPEIYGCFRLIPYLKKNKIVISLGHTNADAAIARQAIEKGATYATHMFNRMPDAGFRQVLLKDRRLYCEVIADGVHVSKKLLKSLINSKGTDKIVLITDSLFFAGFRRFINKGRVFRLKNGRLAGSNITQIQAVKNILRLTTLSMPEAIKLASLNPATILGIEKRKGSISIGKDADLVIIDNDFKVWATIVEGNIAYSKLKVKSKKVKVQGKSKKL